jgi:hypothetical protein
VYSSIVHELRPREEEDVLADAMWQCVEDGKNEAVIGMY